MALSLHIHQREPATRHLHRGLRSRRSRLASQSRIRLGLEDHGANPLTFRATIRRLGGTMVLAIVLAFLLIIVVPDYFTVPLFVILWPTLFFSWPYLSRRLQFLRFPRVTPPPPP